MSIQDPGARYRAHWSKFENEDDIAQDVVGLDSRRQQRQASYIAIAKDYYDLTTRNILGGWGEHFHFCRFVKPGETFDAAQCRHEHFLALMTGMRPGMRVLDAGSGVGEPAREMARFAGVRVTGISINESHVKLATHMTKIDGLSHLVDFVEGDFMHLPFPDSTFDVVYSMEATVYAPDLSACYKELAHVLKPGGIFGTYEWQLTEKFSPENPRHIELRQRIERGDGITNLVAIPGGLDAMRAVGFEVLHHEDLAERGDEKPWWYCIDGDTSKTTCWSDWWLVFRLKEKLWKVWCKVLWVKEFVLRSSPKGSVEGLWTEGMSVFGMRDAAKEGLFTPMYMMVGRKPVQERTKA